MYAKGGDTTRLRTVMGDLHPADEVIEKWRMLGSRALMPNLFYEAEYALAAAMPFGSGVRLLTVWADEKNESRMVAAWPVRIVKFRWGMPLQVLAGWAHPFASLGVPLLDADCAADALAALLSAHTSIRGLPPRAFMPLIPHEGRFSDVLNEVRHRLGLRAAQTETHDRACWCKGKNDNPMVFLSTNTKLKRKKEYRRIARNGPIVFETVFEPDAITGALDDYLSLELSGWKGRKGTAIAQSSSESAFIKQAVSELAKQNRVQIHRLKQGATTLASSITYFNGDHAWYSKISYNENFAKSSPGSQLVLKVTEQFRLEDKVRYADSCAPAGHPMMRRFWPQNFLLSNLTLEMAGGDRLFSLACALERLRPKIRDTIRTYREKQQAWPKQFQEKCATVFHPKLRKNKKREQDIDPT